MANFVYKKFRELVWSAGYNAAAGTVNAILIDLADYTPDENAHDFLNDVPAGARIGTAQTIGSKTFALGVFDGADVSFPAVTGDPAEAILIYGHTGVETTSPLIALLDGKQKVTANAAAAGGATSIQVEPLLGAMASGATIAFSGGVTATLSAPAAAGARSISVNALSGAVAAGEFGDGAIQGSGFPVTPSGGAINVSWSASGICAL